MKRAGCRKIFSELRGLTNDLVRPLTASLILLDSFLLEYKTGFEERAWLNLIEEQLSRATEIFFEIRSIIILQDRLSDDRFVGAKISQEKAKKLKFLTFDD